MPARKLLEMLRTFAAKQCQFIVVGGVAAVLNGAPIQTFDIDLVYSASTENIERILGVLESLDTIFRLQPERRLRPTASHLASRGHLNLLTSSGPLDLLRFIGPNLGYRELLSHCAELNIGDEVRVKVLDLETVISVKEHLASDKDMAVLPILRQTLKESRK